MYLELNLLEELAHVRVLFHASSLSPVDQDGSEILWLVQALL